MIKKPGLIKPIAAFVLFVLFIFLIVYLIQRAADVDRNRMVQLALESYKEGYRQGQIDVANGKMKYELVEQLDGTTEWKMIEEEEVTEETEK